MVNQNPRFSRTRTGAHGGLRRGSATATLGAVLVFSAIIPATPAAAAATGGILSVDIDSDAGELLSGLIGSPTPVKAKPSDTSSPTPSPSPTSTATPTPLGTAAPSPQPGTTSGAPVTSAAQAPAPAAGTPSLTSAAPVPDASAGGSQAQPAPAAGTPAPTANGQEPTGVKRGTEPTDAGTSASQDPDDAATLSAASAELGGRVPEARHAAAEAPVPAVVWWGVGLVAFGASASGLFFKLRRV